MVDFSSAVTVFSEAALERLDLPLLNVISTEASDSADSVDSVRFADSDVTLLSVVVVNRTATSFEEVDADSVDLFDAVDSIRAIDPIAVVVVTDGAASAPSLYVMHSEDDESIIL